MSTIAAIVKNLVGQVFAISAEGFRRQIFEGERLLQGEQVVTGFGGEVVLQLADGEVIRLGGNSRWQAGALEAAASVERAESADDLERVLAAGFDPTLEFEASAAGGGAGGAGSGEGGGHSFVHLSETALRVDPTIGFATDGLGAVAELVVEPVNESLVDAAPSDDGEAPLYGNGAPFGSDLAVIAEEDTPLSGSVSASDVDGDSLTYGKGSDPAHGSVIVNVDGSWTYTPSPDYNGSDSFIVIVSDGNGGSDTITVDVTVAPVDDQVVDANEPLSVAEDSAATSGSLLAGSSSVDGPVSIASFSLAGEAGPFVLGTAYSVAGQGSITVNADGSYSFTPAADWNGSFPVISYTVTDGSGTDDSSTLSIDVSAVNDDFSDADETLSVAEDSAATSGNLLAGSSSVDGALSIASFSIAGEPAGSTFTLGSAYSVAGKGSITVNADGSYSFTPAADWNGSFPVISYTVTDGSGTDDSSTLSIDVSAVNDDFSDADETLSVAEDSAATSGSLLGGTSSVDGPLTIKDFSIAGETGTFTLGSAYSVAGQGSITVNADGSYSFTPAANWNGSFPVVSYTVTDGSGTDDSSALSIIVTPTNDDISDADETLSVAEDSGAHSGNLLAGTASVDGPVSIKDFSVAGAAGPFVLGTAYVVAGKGEITVNADGSYSFTPAADWNGSFPVISYTVTDGSGTDDSSALSITVNPVNDAPVGQTDSVFVNEGSTSTFGSVLDNDTDADLDSLAVVQFATSNAATPTVANGSNSITTALGGAVVMNADGSFSYIAPVLDHSSSSQRTDSFVYRGSDGELQSGWTTVNIIVLDSAPDTNDDEDSVAIGATITGNVITGEGGDAPGGADIFADAPATVVSVSLGGTTYSIPAGGRTLMTANGTLVIQQDGSYSYTAMGQINVDSSESVDRFDYRLADGDGTISAPATLTITAGNSISFSYAENQAMGAVLGTVQATSPSGHAVSYAITGGNADGYFTINSAGGISLTPAGATSLANDYEALDNLHSLTVTVTSSAGVSRDIAVSLAETDRNDAPVNSLPVNYTMDEDTALKLSGLSVADIDAGAGSISVTLSVSRGTLTATTANGVTVSGSGSSSVVLSGTLANINAYLADAATQPAYTPLLDDSGTVALTMTSNDLGNSGPGGALTDTDSIDITINRVADALEGSNVALLVGAPVANTLDFGSNITGLQSKNNYSFPSGILLSTGDPTKTFNWSTGNLLGVTSPGENGTESQRINDADKIELNFPTGMQYMALKLKNAGNDSILIRSDLQVGELTGGVLSGTITSSSGITLSSTNLKVSLILEVAGQVTPVTVQATVNSGGTWSVSYSGVTGTITKATVAAYLDGSLFNQGGNTSANVSYSISSDMQSLSIAQDTLNTYSKNNDGFQIEYIDLSAAPSGTTTYSYPIDLYGVIQDAVGTPESFSGLTLSDLPASVALSIWSEDDQAYHEIAPDAQGVYDLSAYSDLLSTPTVSGTDKIYLVSAGLLPSGFAPTLTVEIADGASIAKTILGGSADSTFAGSAGNDYISGGAGIDTLIGDEGNDILLGGTGADRFVWQTGDTGQDVLKDFNASEGDRIDLSELLQGENTLNILDYLRVDTATSTLQISSAGTLAADGSNADVTIRLENGGLGVDLNPGGLSHDDLVSSLIAGGDPLVKIG